MRRGFTLIELLVVVVVIGLLAGLSISGARQARSRSLGAAMHSDLRTLAVAQENHFAQHGAYVGNVAELPINASPGVSLVVTAADSSGWGATAQHPGASNPKCAIFHGAPPAVPEPAVSEGVIACE